MYTKLNFGTGVSLTSPVSLAYLRINGIYYDHEYQEIIIRLPDEVTDLAANMPESEWIRIQQRVEEAYAERKMLDLTDIPLFRSVSREYTLLHWKAYDIRTGASVPASSDGTGSDVAL